LGNSGGAFADVPGQTGSSPTNTSEENAIAAGSPSEKDEEVPVLLQIRGLQGQAKPKTGAQPKSNTTTSASENSPPPTPEKAPTAASAQPEGLIAQPGVLQPLPPKPKPRLVAQRIPNAIGEYGLSTITLEMIKHWNIGPPIAALDDAYKKWQESKSTENAINYLIQKQKMTEILTDLGFDVRRCTNAVDREIAKNSSKAAYLTELRDKAIRYNTYADFVAGGLTGILSGALEMGDLNRFAYNTVDVLEGTGQSALSYWAYRAEHAGDRRQGAMPNVLIEIIDPTVDHDAYPPTVRSFLETSPPDSNGKTRAQMMLERWEAMNFCFTHSGHKMKKHHRKKHLSGQHSEDATMTIDLLEDRTAMLHDLRAEITTMDEAVAELFDLLKRY